MEKKLFTRQTQCPEANDKWYTLKKAGGISPCIFGKPQAWQGSALANCVGYAWGRFASLEGNEKCLVGCVKGTDWPDDAKDWYTNSKAQGYAVGTTAKLGAVAVWSKKNALGHVAIVEQVNADGSWESSESGLNTRPVWFTKKYNAKSYRAGYTFLGFVYPKYEFTDRIEPAYKFKVGDLIQIIGTGNSRPDGKGLTAYGKNYKRYVLKIHEGKPFPYQIGSKSGITTGYYPEKSLKKL